MAYSTVETVRKVLVGRREENRNENPNELDNDQIQYAIDSADAQIDGVLRVRYKLPIRSYDPGANIFPWETIDPQMELPRLVFTLSVDIAAYLCNLIFLGTTALDEESPFVVRYERARRILDQIRSGQMKLDAMYNIDDPGFSAVFNPYSSPLFPSGHIFGPEYPEGTFPISDYTHG